MNNSSIEKNDVISTDEDLEKLLEVNPKNVSLHKISNFSKAWYHMGVIDYEFGKLGVILTMNSLLKIYLIHLICWIISILYLPACKNQMINLHYCT